MPDHMASGHLTIRLHEALTSTSAPALCGAAREAAAGPDHIRNDLEDVKATDVGGLRRQRPATRRPARWRRGAGVRVGVMPSAGVYRALRGAAILEELPLESPGVNPPD